MGSKSSRLTEQIKGIITALFKRPEHAPYIEALVKLYVEVLTEATKSAGTAGGGGDGSRSRGTSLNRSDQQQQQSQPGSRKSSQDGPPVNQQAQPSQEQQWEARGEKKQASSDDSAASPQPAKAKGGMNRSSSMRSPGTSADQVSFSNAKEQFSYAKIAAAHAVVATIERDLTDNSLGFAATFVPAVRQANKHPDFKLSEEEVRRCTHDAVESTVKELLAREADQEKLVLADLNATWGRLDFSFDTI